MRIFNHGNNAVLPMIKDKKLINRTHLKFKYGYDINIDINILPRYTIREWLKSFYLR